MTARGVYKVTAPRWAYTLFVYANSEAHAIERVGARADYQSGDRPGDLLAEKIDAPEGPFDPEDGSWRPT